ncbi:MAG TPA: aspartate aminotransferase family protein [Chloroflexota bacterium]|jgi:acetylornithine/LysW-gamma-L-lysine aminotransferase|nr:aspartate aminotransferase family protein [Chloroflexota bacterium]
MTEVATQRIEETAEVHLYNKRGISLVRGEGVYLWDSEGRRYLDAMSNYGVNVLGHCHPAVSRAVKAQLERLTNCHQSFYNDARAEFEETLTKLLPAGLRQIAFANSGTEANEAAIKFARLATGRQRLISAEHGYHGRTMGALSVTGVAKYQEGLQPLLGECETIPFDDLDALEKTAPGAAAVILEPVQGESGVHPPAPGYLRAVRQLCDEHGVLLILDEVQTGIGRTGRLFSFEHDGVVPDIISISKGLANGLPMGATVVNESVAGRIPSGAHGSTFAGNPLVSAAATATLRVVADAGFLTHVEEAGVDFIEQLRRIGHPMIREVRGIGLMVAVELKTRVTPYLKALQDAGILALPAGPRTIRFLPPLIIEREQLAEIVAGLRNAMESK